LPIFVKFNSYKLLNSVFSAFSVIAFNY
jgi:hypothetical protein